MDHVDVLLAGVPIWTDHGALGFSTVAAIDGEILVDAGSINRRERLLEAMAAADIAPEEITDVLLTHLHWDHCENLELFPNATLHVNEAQLRAVERGEGPRRLLPGIGTFLDGMPVEPFTPGPVLSGLEAIRTPGHTPQHVSFVHREEPTVLFAGDAVKARADFVRDRSAGSLSWLERIETEGTFVIPGHDVPFYLEGDETIPTAEVAVAMTMKAGVDADTNVTLTSDHENRRDPPEWVSYQFGSL